MNRAFLFPILASITWGAIYALDQKILQKTSPLVFLFIDALITIAVFLPIILLQKNSLTELTAIDRKSMALMAVTVLLTIAADFFILFGVKHLNASIASIIEISYPLFVAIFSYMLFRTAPTLPVFIGGMMIVVGSAIVIRYGV